MEAEAEVVVIMAAEAEAVQEMAVADPPIHLY
jgi:hypothetical protein